MTITNMLVAFAAGASLGAVYFSLLWLSVRRLTHQGGVWLFAAGTLCRFLLILASLYWLLAIAHGGLADLGIAILGFLAARLAAAKFSLQRLQEH